MMNPSSNNCNYNDICFISKLDQDPFSFSFHIPSPYMHYEDEAVLFQDLHNLELQQHSLTEENPLINTLNNMVDSSKKSGVNDPKEGCNNNKAEEIPRKRSSKKDRHSKINTAHGPRDRRMRLSLDVARKFFDLQDMLGFDKASKTVGWLLKNSQSAIMELLRGLPQMKSSSVVLGANCASSTSECEVISSGVDVDESAINENHLGCSKVVKPSCTKEKKKKAAKAPRRIPFHPLAKQSREKARERARERTKEKIRRLGEAKLQIGGFNHQELNRLGSLSSFETGEESGTLTQDYVTNNHSFEMLTEVEELSCHERQLAGTAENFVAESMVAGGNWNHSAPFNFQLNAEICTGPQFADVDQFYCRSSEAYSNTNLCG